MYQPNIIETIGKSTKVIDIPTKLFQNRIIYLGEDIDENTANDCIHQLLVLDYLNNEDINFYIKLTPVECERLQGFPDDWDFGTKKTTACRMIGNAFPPPVAMNIGLQIKKVLDYEQRAYCKSQKKISPRVAI